jgi:hypothetical protein
MRHLTSSLILFLKTPVVVNFYVVVDGSRQHEPNIYYCIEGPASRYLTVALVIVYCVSVQDLLSPRVEGQLRV